MGPPEMRDRVRRARDRARVRRRRSAAPGTTSNLERRSRDRGRLGPRRTRRRSACASTSWSATSTPSTPTRSTPRSPRARRSSATPPPRTRPTSSSRSMPRSSAARRDARGRRRRRRGSTTSSPTCCSSRRRATRSVRDRRATSATRGSRSSATSVELHGSPGGAVLAAPARRTRGRRADRRAPVPAPRRDAPTRDDPRREQRVPRHHGPRLARRRRAPRRPVARLRKGSLMRRARPRRASSRVIVSTTGVVTGSPRRPPRPTTPPPSPSSPTTRSRSRSRCSPRSRTQTGITVKVLQAGDAGAALNQVILTEVEPDRRRVLRRRQHVPARARSTPACSRSTQPRGLSTVPEEYQLDPTPPPHADRPRRRVHQLRQAVVRRRRSSPVPTTLDDLTEACVQGAARGREPGHVVARARVPARDRSPKYGDDGWRDYWSELRANDVKVDDGWEQRVQRRLHARARTRATVPAGRVVRVEPAGGGVLLEAPTRRRRRSAPCSTRASARSSSPASSRAPSTRRPRASSSTSCCRSGSRRTSRSRCSCSRCATARRCPPVFSEVRRGAGRAALAPAGRHRRAPRRVDRAVDRHRAAVTRHRARRRRSLRRRGARRVPRGVLRVPGDRDRRPRARAATGRLDLDPLGDVVTDAALRHIAWFTLWQATLSTVLTLAVGLPGAYVLARCEFPGRRVVRALVTVPFVLPTVVVGSAFVALLGDGGPLAGLGLDQTLGAILIAHVFFNYAVVVRTVGGLWAHLDPRPEEAARMLGASPLARVPRGDAARAAPGDRGRRRRSCSSSRSRRSA